MKLIMFEATGFSEHSNVKNSKNEYKLYTNESFMFTTVFYTPKLKSG